MRALAIVPALLVATSLSCRGHGENDSVLAQLSVSCCTMACFPDGALGHDCDLKSLEQHLRSVAEEKHLRLARVRCETTEERCNEACESPPGVRLRCLGDVLR